MTSERVICTLLLLGWTRGAGAGDCGLDINGNDVVHFSAPKGGNLYFYPDRYETKRGDWAACKKWFRALRRGDDFHDRRDTDSLANAIQWVESAND